MAQSTLDVLEEITVQHQTGDGEFDTEVGMCLAMAKAAIIRWRLVQEERMGRIVFLLPNQPDDFDSFNQPE